MSTEYSLHKGEFREVAISEQSCLYEVSVETTDTLLESDPMEPEEALIAALGIMYAVWCMHPAMVERFQHMLDKDIVELQNKKELIQVALTRYK